MRYLYDDEVDRLIRSFTPPDERDPEPGEVILIRARPMERAANIIKEAIIRAAMILAIAMLGCAVIDYFTFKEDIVIEEVGNPIVELPIGTSSPGLSSAYYGSL